MAGRKRRTDSVLPLQGKVRTILRPCGRSVEAHWPPLTPEHGFPSLSLPRTQGAPPLSVPGWPGRPSDSPPLSQRSQKQRAPMGACRQSPCMNSLRWHYPHQVKGRSSASSQPVGSPVFAPIMARCEKVVKGACKRRWMGVQFQKIKNRGVRCRGLRGDRKGLDP